MDDETTETHDIPGGRETTRTSHQESGDGKTEVSQTEISQNVTEDTVKGDESNEI